MNEEKLENVSIAISGDTYKGVNMIKAEISAEKGKALTWDEFLNCY